MRGVRGDGAKRRVAEAESDRERVKPNDFISQHTSEEREWRQHRERTRDQSLSVRCCCRGVHLMSVEVEEGEDDA